MALVGKVIIGLLAVWLIVIVFMTGPLLHSSDGDENVMRRLTKAMNELELLKRQNDELRTLLADFKIVSEDADKSKDQLLQELQGKLDKANQLLQKADPKLAKDLEVQSVHSGPSMEFEVMRRRIETGIHEMWFQLNSDLSHLRLTTQEGETRNKLNNLLDDMADHKRVLLNDFKNLTDSNGLAEWRTKEAEALSQLIQKRLHYLQNPKDCSTAKKLTCKLNKGCGYGCQIHHAVYCLIMAYGTERTMILKSKGWRYNKEGWEAVFQPVSNTCLDAEGESQAPWPGAPDVQVVDLPIIDSLNPKPPYIPLAIPEDLAERLTRLHGDPVVWWVGQFLKFLLRPQSSLKSVMDETSSKLGFQKPIVGIHVRRTDKVGTEAAFHNIDEYMRHVEEFYKQLELRQPVPKKRVYIASDDPSVIEEAKRKFTNYVIVGDPDISKSAAVATRYSDASLRGIILDIHFLSLCDYLVCTFSSQVCRIAYEIMQTLNPDAASNFHSLDDIYYFGGQNAHNHEVLYPHKPRGSGEISLERGDLIGIAGNHWDGYSKGLNRRTKQQGLYPSYKATNKINTAKFPTYAEADKQPAT